MARGTFGEHLKREREMRGVSLDEISAATRIGTRFLKALEDEQWDRLPGGVFNRGFVRAVARFLGLDEENLLAEYTLATNDRPAAAVSAADMAPQDAGSRRLPWVLALVAVALAAGGWFAWHRYASGRVGHKTVSGTPAQATYRSFGTSQSAATDTTQTPTSAAPLAPARASGRVAPSSASESAVLELKIQAGKPTAVQVLADDKSVFDGKMAAGQRQRFQAREKFEVAARNASALLLELNGQTLPPLGSAEQSAKITLTRKDLRKTPGGPD